jgi:hypothetical protein
MKFRISILSSLILLAFFAINACSVDWTNPGSQTVDQMIAGEDSGSNYLPPGEYGSPAAARAAESVQKGKDILNLPIGGKLTGAGGGLTPQQARSQEQSQTNSSQNVAVNNTTTIQPAVSTEPKSVSGSWSMWLNDSANRTARLTLFQSQDALFGTGSLDLDANTSIVVAASGTIMGDELDLDVVSLGKLNLYRLTLMFDGNSTIGRYTNYSPGVSPTIGSAKGTRFV